MIWKQNKETLNLKKLVPFHHNCWKIPCNDFDLVTYLLQIQLVLLEGTWIENYEVIDRWDYVTEIFSFKNA